MQVKTLREKLCKLKKKLTAIEAMGFVAAEIATNIKQELQECQELLDGVVARNKHHKCNKGGCRC